MVNFLDKKVYVNKKLHIEINLWSGIHFLSGVLSYVYRDNIMIQDINGFLKVHSYWELGQFLTGHNKFDAKTTVDIVFDTTFGFLGYKLMENYSPIQTP